MVIISIFSSWTTRRASYGGKINGCHCGMIIHITVRRHQRGRDNCPDYRARRTPLQNVRYYAKTPPDMRNIEGCQDYSDMLNYAVKSLMSKYSIVGRRIMIDRIWLQRRSRTNIYVLLLNYYEHYNYMFYIFLLFYSICFLE